MLLQSAICPFCNPILLRSIPCSVSPSNASLLTEPVESIGHVFTTLIILQRLNLAASPVLSKGLVPLKSYQGFTLGFQQDDNRESTEIINKGDPVSSMMSSANWEWAMYI